MTDLIDRLRDALSDRYAVESEIGRGGMATVFLAEDLKHRRQVAIKVLHPELAATLGPERFLREIEIAAGLNHPHILPLFDSGEAAGFLYYVMPYVEGESLRQRLEAEGNLPIDDAVAIAAEVAGGLDYAHRQDVIHRDIKPGNILLSEGHALIADFGVARAIGVASEGEGTAAGLAVGTPKYMAPEQMAADTDIDGRADVYALGCVLWEALAGEPPFGGATPQAILARKAVEEAPDVRGTRSEVPESVEVCLEIALASDPAERFATAADFEKALRDAVLLGVSPEGVARRRKRRRRRMLQVSLAVAVVAVGLIAWRTNVRQQQVRWARTEAVSDIRGYVLAGQYDSALDAALRFESILPDDTTTRIPWRYFSRDTRIGTEPAGAMAYYRPLEGADTAWSLLGTTPLVVTLSLDAYRLRVVKEGYVTRELIRPWGWGGADTRHLILDREDSIPSGMVRVNGFQHRPPPDSVVVSDFFLGRYEVTNREYKEFLDAGAYDRPELWVRAFVRNGRDVPWAQAMLLFVDRMDGPGPSTWTAGTYPEGQDDYPVGGLSWYEAAAYADFTGMQLPSVWHLEEAAQDRLYDLTLPISILGHDEPAAVGTSGAEDQYGQYDQYGNVREWTSNASGAERMTFGGGWTDIDHRRDEWEFQRVSPWDRSPVNGLRLVLYTDTAGVAVVTGPFPLAEDEPLRDYGLEQPASAEQFDAYARTYEYAGGSLDPVTELADTLESWPLERVTFTGPDSTERMGVYVFFPKGGEPPYQTVLFSSGYAQGSRSLVSTDVLMFEFLLRTGRAVAVPILTGTLQAYDPEVAVTDNPLSQPPDVVKLWHKELKRTIDYLESRPDIDSDRIGYYGMFFGASYAPIALAVEPRIKAAFIESGALWKYLPAPPPEVDPFHFLPHVRAPVLMMNGRYAVNWPYKYQRPMYDLLGTPPQHKRLLAGEGGDFVPAHLIPPEATPWFNRYLGPVEGF